MDIKNIWNHSNHTKDENIAYLKSILLWRSDGSHQELFESLKDEYKRTVEEQFNRSTLAFTIFSAGIALFGIGAIFFKTESTNFIFIAILLFALVMLLTTSVGLIREYAIVAEKLKYLRSSLFNYIIIRYPYNELSMISQLILLDIETFTISGAYKKLKYFLKIRQRIDNIHENDFIELRNNCKSHYRQIITSLKSCVDINEDDLKFITDFEKTVLNTNNLE